MTSQDEIECTNEIQILRSYFSNIYCDQRALKDAEIEAALAQKEVNGLNSQNGQNYQNGHSNGNSNGNSNGHCETPIADIEDSITDVEMKTKKMEILDKTRGFVKYDREKRLYKEVTSKKSMLGSKIQFSTHFKKKG